MCAPVRGKIWRTPLSPSAVRIRNSDPPQDGVSGSGAGWRLLCRAETRADQPFSGPGVPLQGGNGRTRSRQFGAIPIGRLLQSRARVVPAVGRGDRKSVVEGKSVEL